jgi:hypothetical protein
MKKLTFPQKKNLVLLHPKIVEQNKTSENVLVYADEHKEPPKKNSSSRSERRVYSLDGPGGNYSGL